MSYEMSPFREDGKGGAMLEIRNDLLIHDRLILNSQFHLSYLTENEILDADYECLFYHVT